MTHPVRFVVTDDLRRKRLTVLFRLPLALPHGIWATAWSYSLLLFLPFQLIWAFFAGHLEEDVHRFLARYVRYHVHLFAYLVLLADPWPRFQGRPGYPVDFRARAVESLFFVSANDRANALLHAPLQFAYKGKNIRAKSLDLYVRGSDHLGPFLGFIADQLSEIRWRTRKHRPA